MNIKRATEKEMLRLWGYEDYYKASPTAQFFSENIAADNAQFWAIEDDGRIIGELYVFRKLDDMDFADGKERAYLCAFRICKEYQKRGLGSWLLESVLSYLKSSGIKEVTIGVEEDKPANQRLYNRFGFITKIKDCFVDPCAVDNEKKPLECPCFYLMCKKL